MLRIKSVPALRRRGNFTTSQIVTRFANAWGLLRQLKQVWQVLFTTEKFRSFSLRTQRKRCVYLRLPLVVLWCPPRPWTVGSGGGKRIVIFNELPKLIFCNDVETSWNALLLPVQFVELKQILYLLTSCLNLVWDFTFETNDAFCTTDKVIASQVWRYERLLLVL